MRTSVLAGLLGVAAVGSVGVLVGCGDDLPAVHNDGGDAATGDGRDGDATAGDGNDTRVDGDGDRGIGLDGGDAPPATCPGASFVTPADGAMLHAADDKSGDSCADGFQYDFVVSVAGADNTDVELHGMAVPGTVTDPPLLKTAKIQGGQVRFQNVQLASTGTTRLSLRIGGVTCAATITVMVDCNLPACTISKPNHATLNGVPVAQGGDRASSPGALFQAAFEVTTDIEDGRPVALLVSNVLAPGAVTTVTVNAMSGKAAFPGVTLQPDGDYKVEARCTNAANQVGRSQQLTYSVDTTPPALVVDRPMNGQAIAPGSLTNGAFPVCATTTSSDAVNLPSSLGTRAQNLCVTRGSATMCTPVTAVNTSTCINLTCTASGDIVVTLGDVAGNQQSQTITGVTCASALPLVSIVEPPSDAPAFAIVGRRLLAASSAQARKDKDGAMPGAQTDVIACTDKLGATAKLFAGHAGDATLTQLGAAAGVTTVAAVAADNCTAGLGAAAHFTGVTLPESTENADGTLAKATEIRVDVTDPATPGATGTSGPTDLWVDSIAPTLSEKTPTPLCGISRPGTSFMTDVTLNANTPTVTFQVTNGGVTTPFGPPAFASGVATFTAVAFPAGMNVVVATATDSAGNVTTLAPPTGMATCTVNVGTAPVVSFRAPLMGINLCAAGNTSTSCQADGDGAMPGWQGTLTARVTVGGLPLTSGTISFSIGATILGTGVLNVAGDASLATSIADAPTVTITATINDATAGMGTASATVIVDTINPTAVALLTPSVLNRRATSFQLMWTAPTDGGSAVVGYDIRRDVAVLSDPTFGAAPQVTFSGTPQAPGSPETLTVGGLLIETPYFFAIRALDVVGNASPTTFANGPAQAGTTASFNRTTLTAMPSNGNEQFGYTLDGTGDVNGDGRADLVVGDFNSTRAFLFLGQPGGFAATPSVVFTGPMGFGNGARTVGDVDGDGFTDLAIARSVGAVAGRVSIYRGRTSWTATMATLALTDDDADYHVVPDASYTSTNFGLSGSLAAAGDFDGDGTDDMAIGARSYAGGGRVVVVRGGAFVGRRVANCNRLAGECDVMLPSVTETIVINPEAGQASGFFGSAVTSIGRFYTTTSGGAPMMGDTLVISGYGVNSLAGRIYAFRPQNGVAGIAAAADQTVDGSSGLYGFVIPFLGPLGASPGAVGVSGNSSGVADVYLGTAATGPIAAGARVRITSADMGFGNIFIGTGVPGTSRTLNMIGSAEPDVVVAGSSGNPSDLHIISGAKIASSSGSVAVGAIQDVVVKGMPANWAGYGPAGTLVSDLDGDGWADFAVGEYAATIPGRVIVFW